MKERVYVYPSPSLRNSRKEAFGSPYVTFLTESLRKRYTILNENPQAGSGVLNIVRLLLKIDVIFFNWIEDLADKKSGIIQVFLLLAVLASLKIRHKKIVWIMHNKLSHERRNRMLKRLTAKAMLKLSSLVITHAKEGPAYARAQLGGNTTKFRFIHHPFMRHYMRLNTPYLYDIIIWGTIIPYKGVDRFLKHLKDNNLDMKYSIYVVGKISPPSYRQQIMKLSNERIRIEDRFLPQEALDRSIAASRIILFAYNAESVLSSASLMDSVIYDKPIVGPNSGAFQDLAEEGIIATYSDLPESVQLIDSLLKNDSCRNHSKVERFIASNNWENYTNQIAAWLGNGGADKLLYGK